MYCIGRVYVLLLGPRVSAIISAALKIMQAGDHAAAPTPPHPLLSHVLSVMSDHSHSRTVGTAVTTCVFLRDAALPGLTMEARPRIALRMPEMGFETVLEMVARRDLASSSAGVAVGAASMLFGLVFLAVRLIRPRALGDPALLSWNQ